jgi:SAM-dependent methyltransferase
MIVPYRLMYRLGLAPWERREVGEIWPRIGMPEPGRALDVGCGRGRDAVYLAQQGWQVTAVDVTEEALETARERAKGAGVDIQWIRADAGNLGALGLEPGYTLVYDFGCMHGLPDDARAREAAAITELAAPGARLALLAFKHGPRRLVLPRGMDEEEVLRLFGDGWEPAGSESRVDDSTPAPIRRARPTLYLFTRKDAAAAAQ